MTTDDTIALVTKFSNTLEIGLNDVTLGTLVKPMDLLDEEYGETKDAIIGYATKLTVGGRSGDELKEDIIDGYGDIAFIALNGIYKTFRWIGDSHTEATLKTSEVMIRIATANLSKLQPDGSVHYDDNGKVQKPEGWRPPQYKDLL